MGGCIVPKCKSRSERKDETVSFHRLPGHNCLRSKWLKAINRSRGSLGSWSVCSKHFEEKYFIPRNNKVRRLTKDAFPTLLIPTEDGSVPPSTGECACYPEIQTDTERKVEEVEADSEFLDAQLAHSDEQIDIEESDVKQERLDIKKEWLGEDSVVDNLKNEDSAPPPDGLLKECRGLGERINIEGYSDGSTVCLNQLKFADQHVANIAYIPQSYAFMKFPLPVVYYVVGDLPVSYGAPGQPEPCPPSTSASTTTLVAASCERDSVKVDHVCHACSYKVNERKLLRIHQMFSCCKDTLKRASGSTENSQSQIVTHSGLKSLTVDHKLTLSDHKAFACNQCSYKTIKRSHLKSHKIMHARHKAFACDQCSFRTNYLRSLKGHKLLHSKHKPFACDQCDCKYTLESSLKKHKMIHCATKPFACDQCDYKSTLASSLKKHKMTHSAIKPFTCDQCDYKSTLACSLKIHKMSHSAIKPFACDQCDYKSILASGLKSHKLTHSVVKPFACDQCSYKSKHSKGLKMHLITHSEHKPYACDKCSFKTRHLGTLKEHKLAHSGHKLYACNQCDYKSTKGSLLRSHKLTHSVYKPFACDQCDYKSARASCLKHHKLTHSATQLRQ